MFVITFTIYSLEPLLKNYLEEVITSTLNVISATTNVILLTEEVITATLKII